MKVQSSYSSFILLCFSSGIRGLIGVLFCSFRHPSRRFELVQFDSFKHFLTFSWRVVFFYGITTFLWTLPIKKNKDIKVTLFEKWWQKADPQSLVQIGKYESCHHFSATVAFKPSYPITILFLWAIFCNTYSPYW